MQRRACRLHQRSLQPPFFEPLPRILMPKILRALLIAATATGVAAAVYVWRQPVLKAIGVQADPDADASPFVDADQLSEEEKQELADELGAML